MNLGRKWSPGTIASRCKEDRLLAKYFERVDELMFTEVNVAYPESKRRQRRVDSLRVINPPLGEGEAYRYGPNNRSTIWQLIDSHSIELIEVHDWGFHAFGQVVGKAEIMDNLFDPVEVNKTVLAGEEWVPTEGNPDPAAESVYSDFDADWVVIET